MHKETVRIAGAGLAGLSAAIGLARGGSPVEVFEKNEDSGRDRHTEWDGIENWTTKTDLLTLLTEWGITPSFEYRPRQDFEVYAPNGDCYSVRTTRPLLYLLKRGSARGSIEQALKQQALDYGVTINYGRARSRDDVDIWAVGSQRSGVFLGVGMTFRTTHPDTVIGLFGIYNAPKAYSYLVVVDGQATISVVLTRDFKRARLYLARSVERFRQIEQFNMEDVRLSSGFGGVIKEYGKISTHPLVVGEAAGFQDYLWGFGIRHALHSGQLAALAILDGLSYQTLVRREIYPQIHTSLINRGLYDFTGDRTYQLLVKRFAASPDLGKLLQRFYHGSVFHLPLWALGKGRRGVSVFHRTD